MRLIKIITTIVTTIVIIATIIRTRIRIRIRIIRPNNNISRTQTSVQPYLLYYPAYVWGAAIPPQSQDDMTYGCTTVAMIPKPPKTETMWEFPKTGDPNIVPEIVGSFLERTQNKVPPNFRKLPCCPFLHQILTPTFEIRSAVPNYGWWTKSCMTLNKEYTIIPIVWVMQDFVHQPYLLAGAEVCVWNRRMRLLIQHDTKLCHRLPPGSCMKHL